MNNKYYTSRKNLFLGTKSHCEAECSFRKAEVNEDELDEEISSVEGMMIFTPKNVASCHCHSYLSDDSPIHFLPSSSSKKIFNRTVLLVSSHQFVK
jgi:hypothetical protein